MLIPGAKRRSGRSTGRRLRPVRGQVERRAAVLFAVYLLVFGGIGYRLVSVQVVNAQEYAALGEQQRSRTIDLMPTRGRIYDRNGDVLASSVDAATVYADPRAYRAEEREDGLIVPPAAEAGEVAAELAPILDRDVDELTERLRRDAHFVYLARQLPWEVGEEIAELGLPGVGILTEPDRVYPAGPLGAQVLGFTGIDGDGLSGLEVQYDTILRGVPGQLYVERAPRDLEIASGDRHVIPPTDGTDLVLTIDRELQHIAERAAREAVETHDAAGAGVVVLDVGSGDVLAMASLPGYDPNEPGRAEPDARRNRTVTDMFEPGSIQKSVTIAAAIEEGIVDPGSTIDVPRSVTVAGKRFTDTGQRDPGPLTVREIMARSSNVGSILLAQRLGAEKLGGYLDAFGYGRPLGLGFPGESGGAYLPVEDWSATSLPTIAIGHGVATTLLQAAGVYATIANDGVARQPRLVRGSVGPDGHLEPVEAGGGHQIVSEDTARQVREMLIGAVHGEVATGHRAAVPGYFVAGKTGTARKPLRDARGYSDEYIASFVGFAPAEEPRFVIAVMVDEPSPAYYGGSVAAPVFSEVASFALNHRRVPPDHVPSDDAAPPSG